MADNEFTYSQLVSQVLSDFDGIFDQLVAKSAKFGTSNSILKEGNKYDGSVPTNKYAEIIRDNFFVIDGLFCKNGEEPVKNYYNSTSLTEGGTGALSIDSETEKYVYTIPVAAGKNGYYDGGAKIKTAINTTELAISSTTIKNNGTLVELETPGVSYYSFSVDPDPAATKAFSNLISSVTINKGSVDLKVKTSRADITIDPTITFETTGVEEQYHNIILTTLEGSGLAESDVIALPYSNAFNIYNSEDSKKYEISVDLQRTITEGFVTADDVSLSASHSIDGTEVTKTLNANDDYVFEIDNNYVAENQYFYIKQGSVKLDSVGTGEGSENNGTADITASGVTLLTKASDKISTEEYFTLKPSISGLNVSATVTEGYVIPNSDGKLDVGEIVIGDAERYLKKSKTSTTTESAGEGDATGTAFGISVSDFKVEAIPGGNSAQNALYSVLATATNTPDDYTKFKVSLGTGTNTTATAAEKIKVTEGYTQSNTFSTVNVTGNHELFIKNGSAAVTVEAPVSFDSGIATINKPASGTEGTDYYKITATSTISGKLNTSVGFIETSEKAIKTTDDEGAEVDITSSEEIYVDAAKVVLQKPSIITTEYVSQEGDTGAAEDPSKDEIFGAILLDSPPSRRDYFTVELSSLIDTTNSKTGYLKNLPGNVLTSGAPAKDTKYIPRAVVEWVEPGDGKEGYLSVSESGFLPSGKIFNIDNVAEGEGNAVLTFGIKDSSSSIFEQNVANTDDYQKLDFSITVDPGYISESTINKGALKNASYYVKNAKDVKATLANSITTTSLNPTWNSSESVYDVTVSSQASATMSGEAGYLANVSSIDVGYVSGTGDSATFTSGALTTSKTLKLNKLTLDSNAIAVTADTDAIPLAIYTDDITDNNIIKTSVSGSEASKFIKLTAAASTNSKVSLTATATTSGYLAQGDTVTALNITAETLVQSGDIFIKKGTTTAKTDSTTVLTPTTGDGALTVDKAALGSTGKVTISGEFTPTLTVNAGYYDGTESITGTKQTVSKEIDIGTADGSINSVQSTADFSSSYSASSTSGTPIADVIKFHDVGSSSSGGNTETTTKMAKVTFNGSTSTSLNITTNGYIDGDIAKGITGSGSVSKTVGIELFNNGTEKITETIKGEETEVDVYKIDINVADYNAETTPIEATPATIITTDDKYLRYKTKINIGANVMGADVANQLLALQRRLNGYNPQQTTTI